MFQTLQSQEEIESTGVGLSIVRKSLESVGGSVRIESSAGQGATFHVDWPLVVAGRDAPTEKSCLIMRVHRPAILLVEDNDLDAEKVVRAFSRLGVSRGVRRAHDGLEALARCCARRCPATLAATPTQRAALDHVVLLDLNMPRNERPGVPRGAARGPVHRDDAGVRADDVGARERDIVAAHRHHVAGYLVKPTTMQEMLDTLGAVSRFWDLCRLPRETA